MKERQWIEGFSDDSDNAKENQRSKGDAVISDFQRPRHRLFPPSPCRIVEVDAEVAVVDGPIIRD
jgi:hypothetical protein